MVDRGQAKRNGEIKLNRYDVVANFCGEHLDAIIQRCECSDEERAMVLAGVFISAAASINFDKYIQRETLRIALDAAAIIHMNGNNCVEELSELAKNL